IKPNFLKVKQAVDKLLSTNPTKSENLNRGVSHIEFDKTYKIRNVLINEFDDSNNTEEAAIKKLASQGVKYVELQGSPPRNANFEKLCKENDIQIFFMSNSSLKYDSDDLEEIKSNIL